MIECMFRPIESWPGEPTPPAQRRRSPFRASYTKTLDLLEDELRHLGGHSLIVQAYFTREQIRNDGWPRSTASPSEPGVVLTFESDAGPMRFAADRFNHWEDNIRAIALGLNALRTVDRYGITSGREQYRGFAALPAAGGATAPSVEACVAVLAELSGLDAEAVRLDPKRAYRLMAQRHHPDKRNGDDADWRRGEAAYRLLTGGAA